MPSTTKKSKHDTLPKASKPPRDSEDAKAQARAFAARAAKRGQDYTTAYIKAWRRLSGLSTRRPVGPVA